MVRKARYSYMLKQLFKTTPKLKLEVERFKYSKSMAYMHLILVESLLQMVRSLNNIRVLQIEEIILLNIVVLELKFTKL